MSLRLRKFLCLVVLLVGLPAYIALAWYLVNEIDRPHILVELGVYVVLGVLWALPLRWLFLGVASAQPEQETDHD